MTTKLLNDEKTQARFWEKVRKTDDCWLWVGHKNTMTNLGLFAVARNDIREAHIVSYEMANGPIVNEKDKPVQIEFTCKNRRCVRPDHIQVWIGNYKEIRAQKSVMVAPHPKSNAARKAQTHCKRGHPFDEKNTIYNKKDNSRICRTCKNEQRRKTKVA